MSGTVLTIGVDATEIAELRRHFHVIDALDASHAPDLQGVSVVLASAAGVANGIQPLLQKATAPQNRHNTSYIVINGGDASQFQDLVDEDRLFYLARGTLDPSSLVTLINAAIRRASNSVTYHPRLSEGIIKIERLRDFYDQLTAQDDYATAGRLLADTARLCMRHCSTRFFIYDATTLTLMCASRSGEVVSEESASSGILGYVACTLASVNVSRAQTDPRYDAELDNPDGMEESLSLIAAPVLAGHDELLGVLAAVRPSQFGDFTAEEIALFHLLIDYATAPISTLYLRESIRKEGLRAENLVNNAQEIYRPEAWAQHVSEGDSTGSPLFERPRWLQVSHWLAVALLLFGVILLALARTDETVVGPAVIRAEQKVSVSANATGIIRTLNMVAGDRVHAGIVLATVYEPGGQTTVDQLRAQVRAPSDGVVGDVRVRLGQQVALGDQVASIIAENSGYEVVALLPGSSAPNVGAGMSIVLKVDGFADAREVLQIQRVSPQVLGPHEAARYVGRESTDPLIVSGPVVIATSRIPSETFTSRNRSYRFSDGLPAHVEVTLRSGSLLTTLAPALKGIARW